MIESQGAQTRADSAGETHPQRFLPLLIDRGADPRRMVLAVAVLVCLRLLAR